MTAIEVIYIICFFLGLGYAVVTFIFGGAFGGDADAGSGGFDVDHDVAGHIETGVGTDYGTIHFSPISPVVIAMFVTSFGAMGMVCLKFFKLSNFASLPIAVFSGIVIAALSFFVFQAIFRATQASSEARQAELVGLEAEVITPIPNVGLGEIAYIFKGSRYTAPARSVYKTEVPSHTVVTIEKVVGNIVYVKSSESSKVL